MTEDDSVDLARASAQIDALIDKRAAGREEAKGGRDGRPQPYLWPASGPNARKWNPTPPPPPTAWGEGDT
jgi:hypothetical protein